jgi:hypothetical protein
LLAPSPTPIPEDQASVFISPRDRVAAHFSRLLRHAWVTVGLFLFPGHHTGNTTLNQRYEYEQRYHPTEREIKKYLYFLTYPRVHEHHIQDWRNDACGL